MGGLFVCGFIFFIFGFRVSCCFFFFSCYFLFFLVGANSIFFPLHCVGLLGFPRRISDFSLSYVWLTVFTLFGLVFLFLFCFLLFFCGCLYVVFWCLVLVLVFCFDARFLLFFCVLF